MRGTPVGYPASGALLRRYVLLCGVAVQAVRTRCAVVRAYCCCVYTSTRGTSWCSYLACPVLAGKINDRGRPYVFSTLEACTTYLPTTDIYHSSLHLVQLVEMIEASSCVVCNVLLWRWSLRGFHSAQVALSIENVSHSGRILLLTDSSLRSQLVGATQLVKRCKEAMADISEDRVDLLEEKMRAKIDTMTGFSDVEGKSRALHKVRETTVANVECLMNSTRTLRVAYHVPHVVESPTCLAYKYKCRCCLIAWHPMPILVS